MSVWQLDTPFLTGEVWVGDTYLGDNEVETAIDEIDLVEEYRGVPASLELPVFNGHVVEMILENSS